MSDNGGFAIRAAAFRAAFNGPDGQEVLDDLAHFCCANRTTVSGSETNMTLLEGRRQVWLHIQQLRNFTGDAVQQFALKD
jgi:hypothetical protein